MELHLQHIRTGDTVKLSPDGTLIGAAEHAAIGAGGEGPYLGALVVRYPSGWALYGLSDEDVTFNRRALRPGQRVNPKKGDLLGVGDERYTVLAPGSDALHPPEPDDDSAPSCFAYVTNPDGMEECRAVDHNLLFGRLAFCHVQLPDTRLSRMSALLAAHDGDWYVHTLSKKPLGRNRKAVRTSSRVSDGDELLIGPLVVRLEIKPNTAERRALAPGLTGSRERPPLSASVATDTPDTTDTPGPRGPDSGPDLLALRASGQELENWIKRQPLPEPGPKSGLGGWLGAQRDRLRRFWLDTPETTLARSLRTAGRVAEAFAVLDRAIRTRPDGPELHRELYRLYESLGMLDLCYRPLRHIEKLAQARGTPDPWVLETLAQVCEKLGGESAEMYDRAVAYWGKLETATGASYQHQKDNVMARRALHDGGYASTIGD
ncbi:MAG TPA: FHA domain-containing protein [Gemmata sp.]